MLRPVTFLFFLLSLPALTAPKFFPDDPLEFEPKYPAVTDPARRKLSDYYEAVQHSIATPGELNRNRAVMRISCCRWWSRCCRKPR